VSAQVSFSLADHKGVSSGFWTILALSMMVPVLGFLYVRLERFILRRAGIPPIEEHIASLRLVQEEETAEPIELRKAA
jgi:hypothetical protein